MSDDWQPGDLALCVRGGNMDQPSQGDWPVEGRLYSVAGVRLVTFYDGEDLALFLENGPANQGEIDGVMHVCSAWWHGRFIKVTPRAADAFDREVISAMTGDRISVGRNV